MKMRVSTQSTFCIAGPTTGRHSDREKVTMLGIADQYGMVRVLGGSPRNMLLLFNFFFEFQKSPKRKLM